MENKILLIHLFFFFSFPASCLCPFSSFSSDVMALPFNIMLLCACFIIIFEFKSVFNVIWVGVVGCWLRFMFVVWAVWWYRQAADTFGGSELEVPGPNSVVFYLSFCYIFEKVYLQVSSMTLDRSRSPPQAKRLRSSDRASYWDAPYPKDRQVHRFASLSIHQNLTVIPFIYTHTHTLIAHVA